MTEVARGMRIRIIDTPPGEAPLDVRRAWIGIELPLAPGATGPEPALGVGVLTGPRRLLSSLLHIVLGRAERLTGYRVRARAAFEHLERHAPEAAAWWRQNAPHLVDHDRVLLFHSDVCEPLVDAPPR